MIVLNQAEKNDMIRWGRTLLHGSRDQFSYFQETAQWVAEQVYYETRQTNHERLFALVRVFRLSCYHEVPYGLKTLVNPDEGCWMTLMGTMGDYPHWCDHRLSADQKMVSLGKGGLLDAAFEQLELEPGVITDRNFSAAYEGLGQFPYFLTDRVDDFLTAEDFSLPHHIKSVVGIGSAFLSGASYVLLGYSREFLTLEDAEVFGELSAFVTTLLASPDAKRRFWS